MCRLQFWLSRLASLSDTKDLLPRTHVSAMILALPFRSIGVIALKKYYMIWLSNLLTVNVT
jgi:hypothetical protein